MLCRDYCWWRSSPIYYGLSLPEPLFTMSLTSGSVMGDSTTVSDGRANAGCHRGKQKDVSKSAIKSEPRAHLRLSRQSSSRCRASKKNCCQTMPKREAKAALLRPLLLSSSTGEP